VGRGDGGMFKREVNLYPASLKTKNGTKYGYINNEGTFKLKPVYDSVMEFQDNGLAVIEKDSLYGIINKNGRYIVKPSYNTIVAFSEGRATVYDDKGWYVINEKGQKLTSKPYSFIGTFEEERALYSFQKDASYMYGYLDLQGNEIIPAQYNNASDFADGTALVQKEQGGNFTLIDASGKVVNTFSKPFVMKVGRDLLAFKNKDKFDAKMGIMDSSGKVLIKPTYSSIQNFQDERAVVNLSNNFENNMGLIDEKGKYYINPNYNDIIMLGHKRVAVGKAIKKDKPYLGSIYAIATTTGEILTDFIFTSVMPFEKGYASVSDEKNTYFINKTGKKALPVIEGVATLSFEGNLIKALLDQRVSYLSKTGTVIWSQNTIIPLNRQYKIIEKKYKRKEDYYVYYPMVNGMKNKKAEKKVNEKLFSLSKPDETPEIKEYTYAGDFSVEFFKEQLLVLKLDGYLYPLGAAHGMPTQNYPIINLTTGAFYELSDLFLPGSDYVKILSSLIENMIETDETYSYVFKDQYKGISKNQPFYVTDEALYIYFAPYEIGPYAAGFPTFKIPYEKIKDIINTVGEFWKAYH
jgi:hypothetical protein